MDPIQASIDLFHDHSRDLKGFACLVYDELKPYIIAGAGREIGVTATKNLFKIFDRTRAIHKEDTGQDLTPEDLSNVPLDVGAELIRVARFVVDEELVESYASLLESFVQDGESSSRVAFVSMLNNMSGLDAIVFRRIYSIGLKAPEVSEEEGGFSYGGISKETDALFAGQNLAIMPILTTQLPVSATPYNAETSSEELRHCRLTDDIFVSLGNLARLNLIEPDRIFDGGMNYKLVFRTPLGSALAAALRIQEQS